MSTPAWSVLEGDCLDLMRATPAGSVDCCVTSPPYWGLRDYGTGRWEGGDAACAHRVGGQVEDNKAPGAITTGQRPGVDASRCLSCGAKRVDKQLGLEATPQEYVEKMVAVFREVRRVLRDDGTLWLNLGDSYAGSGPSGASYQSETTKAREGKKRDGSFSISATLAERGLSYAEKKPVPPPGLKAKDLVGIPWWVAFALQADGWWLRSDIIWAKPNPMPESVTDRPTKAHEYLFLLSKSAAYYYDSDAIAEPGETLRPRIRPNGVSNDENKAAPLGFDNSCGADGTRNRRTVWTIPTKPYHGAHFAVMPTALVKPCVLAGCRKGGLVLDPFAGSGTVGVVAVENDCRFLGIDLNPAYVAIARARIGEAAKQGRLFTQAASVIARVEGMSVEDAKRQMEMFDKGGA